MPWGTPEVTLVQEDCVSETWTHWVQVQKEVLNPKKDYRSKDYVKLNKKDRKQNGVGVPFFPIFFCLFQFLSLFSCTVVFEWPASVLHLWWKLVKNIKELTETMKVLKGQLFLCVCVFVLKSKLVFASIWLRALSFCQNWPARPVSLQRKWNNLKEHLHDNPSHSSEGVYIIVEVC